MEKTTTQDTFPILGMSCAACAARVDKTLNKQPGVCQASVNYAAATALVEYDPSQTSPEALQHAVQEAGYDLVITHDEHAADEVEEAHRKKYQLLKRRTTWAILLAIPIAVIGMGFMDRPWAGWSTWLLSTPVVFGLGRSFFVNAWKQLRHGSANMDTLVSACSTCSSPTSGCPVASRRTSTSSRRASSSPSSCWDGCWKSGPRAIPRKPSRN